MTLLLGVDFSTLAIHAAAIPLDPAARMRPELRLFEAAIPKVQDKSQRCRAIMALTRGFYLPEVTTVWIEEPWGPYRNADRALLPIYGALLATVPPNIPATGIHTQDWRRALGLSPNLAKADSIKAAQEWLVKHAPTFAGVLNEHHAEALLIAAAGRVITWR